MPYTTPIETREPFLEIAENSTNFMSVPKQSNKKIKIAKIYLLVCRVVCLMATVLDVEFAGNSEYVVYIVWI